jgi:hypothetical protein
MFETAVTLFDAQMHAKITTTITTQCQNLMLSSVRKNSGRLRTARSCEDSPLTSFQPTTSLESFGKWNSEKKLRVSSQE